MRLRAGFRDGFVAKRDQFIIEYDRLDIPQPVPRKIDITFRGELFARYFCFTQHSLQGAGVEMALIERDSTFFDHARDNSRLCCARADRANALTAALSDSINLGAHLCSRQKCIASPVHRRTAGMRRLSAKCDGVTLHAKSSEDR